MSNTPPPLDYGPPASPTVFAPDQLVAVAEARRQYAPIRRELSVAKFDAWSVAVFAGLTVLFSLTSPSALLVGLGMGVVAFVEFRTIKRLQALDPAAPRTLGVNQLGFAAVLIVYAGYKLMFPGPGLSDEIKDAAAADPDMAKTLASLSETINFGIYAGVILFALVFQVGCAIYHFTRTRVLRRYLDRTPAWILQLHSAGLMN